MYINDANGAFKHLFALFEQIMLRKDIVMYIASIDIDIVTLQVI